MVKGSEHTEDCWASPNCNVCGLRKNLGVAMLELPLPMDFVMVIALATIGSREQATFGPMKNRNYARRSQVRLPPEDD